jgi:hypothetical protein
MPGPSLIETAASGIAKGVASRYSRRSFVGHLGRVAIVLTGSGAGVGLLASPASALQCDGCDPDCAQGCGNGNCPCSTCGHSVTCKGLTGTGGRCPSNTFACGSWVCSCPSCPSPHLRRWTDCCGTGQCNGGANCHCHSDVDGRSRPTCCYTKCYKTGNGGGAGTCSDAYIVCRFEKCA